jgi:hypothetical protein
MTLKMILWKGRRIEIEITITVTEINGLLLFILARLLAVNLRTRYMLISRSCTVLFFVLSS